MQLLLNADLSQGYTSNSQRARVSTEPWVMENVYCPNCGLKNWYQYPNNERARDFRCLNCEEDFELKSRNKTKLEVRLAGAAYDAIMERIQDNTCPNFFLLNYHPETLEISNFVAIPKQFFVPAVILKRKPLAPTARRAGWVGCYIMLKDIPEAGKIFIIKDGEIRPQDQVLKAWRLARVQSSEAMIQE